MNEGLIGLRYVIRIWNMAQINRNVIWPGSALRLNAKKERLASLSYLIYASNVPNKTHLVDTRRSFGY